MKSYSFTKAKQALDTSKHENSLAHFKDLEKASEKDILYKVALKKIAQLERKLHFDD